MIKYRPTFGILGLIIAMISFSKKYIISISTVVVVISILIHFYMKPSKDAKSTPIAVSVSAVQQKDVTITTHAIGTVQPFVTVSVKSRVDGQLIAVGFKEGDYVEEGQVIFQIDPKPFRVALQQAQANLAHNQAQLEQFKKTLERYKPLVKKGYVSQQEYDQAAANAKGQEAAVLADKAAVANAQLNLDYCTIRSSIAGKTGNLLVNSGNLIKTTDINPLVVIDKMSPVYVNFSLPEQALSSIQQEMKKGKLLVDLQVKNQSTILQGQISFIDNTVDSTTGTIKLKAIFDNKHEELWPGEYVDVTLPYAKIQHALLIPTRAIQASPDGSYVFVVGKDSSVTLKTIKTGAVLNNDTIIEGLTVGDIVVLTGQAQLVDGSFIHAENNEKLVDSTKLAENIRD
ncbi:MAG: efflux RND transporter periplasmic adaptor subunit [Gammaproteobacteria bacterium]|nr:efflux RND transporter periplasmic adaptor subunit [Gammaproteobacteria bacterium]